MPGNVGKDPVQTILETTDHGIVLHMCNDVEHIKCFNSALSWMENAGRTF